MNAEQFKALSNNLYKACMQGEKVQFEGGLSGIGEGFTWLQAGLLHGSFSSSNCYSSILKVGLSHTALALASGGAMGTQLAIGGRLGTAWATV